MKQTALLFFILVFSFPSVAQRLINGQVLDAQTREPLAGATIRLADSSLIVTDAKGKFEVGQE
jgi:hypothetical protein